VAVNLGDFRADYASVDDLLHDPDGPVGLLILELSERAAVVAKETAHVFPGTPRSTVWKAETSTAMLPSGIIRESVHVHLPVRGTRGGMYGGVNVLFQAVFLEFPPKGSVQMYDRYPFMTTGLDSLIGEV
jgi:hypothetical protein